MARLNRSSLSFMGLVVSLGTASMIGCGLDTHGLPPDDTASSTSSGMGGAGGGGGMAGAGGAMVCKPGMNEPCYSGPANTPNIGPCKAGTKTCLADGTGYGACVGEVIPTLENCVTVGDEDCDDLEDLEDSECKCTTPGSPKTPCDTGKLGICTAGVGVCGLDGRSVDDCTQTDMATPENCATAEDDDCDGTAGAACTGVPTSVYAPLVSSMSPNDDAIYAVAFTPDGGSVIAGVIDGAIDANDGYTVSKGTAYVAKRNANNAIVWEKKFTSSTFAVVRGVAVDKDGNILVTGSFDGNFAIDTVSAASNSVDAFLVKLNPAGMVSWAKFITSSKLQNAFGVAVDMAGNAFVTGSTDDPVNFGSGDQTADGVDAFVASYAPDGMVRWGKLYKSMGNQIGRNITTASNGDVLVIGDTSGAVNFGGGPVAGGGNQDIFVARISGDGMTNPWTKLYGKMGDQFGRGIGLAPDGSILITGSFAGTIDWPMGTSMTAIGTLDVYVAQLDAMTGDHLAHAQGGKTGVSVGNSIGTDASGNVTVFGHFDGAIDFGGQEVTSMMDTYDAFLVKLKTGDLKRVWTNVFGKAGNQFGWDVAVANDGSSLAGGDYIDELDAPPLATIKSGDYVNRYAVHVAP